MISIPKDSITGTEIKTISTYIFRDHRFSVGLLGSVHSTVQVHPCWRLLADRVLRVEGARSLLLMGQAGCISTMHWSILHSTLDTTVHFNGSNGTAYTRPLSVCYNCQFVIIDWFYSKLLFVVSLPTVTNYHFPYFVALFCLLY